MSVSSATTWEVRPSVGSNTNGGGFVTGASGTDYSQQNSKNSGGNNGSTTDAVATGVATITSATASFTSAIVGNIIYLQGGTGSLAAGWYQVTVFNSSTSITLDRTVATGTGITMNIGGALADLTVPVADGGDTNTVYIKSTGTITVTSAVTLTYALTIIGYSSSRGDGGQATITTSTNSIDLIAMNIALNPTSGSSFQNLILTSTAGTPGDGIHEINGSNGPALTLLNCSLSGFNIGIIGDWQAKNAFFPLTLFNTEVKSCVSDGVENTGPTQIIGCFIHGNGRDGIRLLNTTGGPTKPLWVFHSIIYNNTGCGINNQINQSQNNVYYGYVVCVNTALVSNGSDGLQQTQESSGSYGTLLANCIIFGNGGFGVDLGTSGQLLAIDYCNAYGSNTSGDTNHWTKGTGAVALSGSPFTNASGGDFSLNSTSGEGAACKGAGFPGVLQVGGTGHIDIGPLQSSGGGSTTVKVIAPTQIRILGRGR